MAAGQCLEWDAVQNHRSAENNVHQSSSSSVAATFTVMDTCKRRPNRPDSAAAGPAFEFIVMDTPTFPKRRRLGHDHVCVNEKPLQPHHRHHHEDAACGGYDRSRGFVVIREFRDDSVTPPLQLLSNSHQGGLFPRSTAAPSPGATFAGSARRDFGSGVAMERTASGLSIESDSSSPSSFSGRSCSPTAKLDHSLMTDDEALKLVLGHMGFIRERVVAQPECSESQSEWILRAIIGSRPSCGPRGSSAKDKSGADEWAVDDAVLTSILIAANRLFFGGRLSGRVKWDWSHPEVDRYESSIIGTTAFRRMAVWGDSCASAAATHRGGERIEQLHHHHHHHQQKQRLMYDGFETLIVLSRPILQSASYSRHLVISTFLHELIHCFLFVCCGPSARRDGGHTRAFRRIAEAIDRWAGVGVLHLGEMEADLERFRNRDRGSVSNSFAADAQRPFKLGTPTRYRRGPAPYARDPGTAEWRPPPNHHGALDHDDGMWDHVVHDEWDGYCGRPAPRRT